MTTNRQGTLRRIAAVLVLAILLVVSAVLYLGRPRPEDRYPVTAKDQAIPYTTATVTTPDLWENQRVVTTKGKDGLLRTYTYYHERVAGDRVTLREKIETPAGEPSSELVTRPTTEVVTVGTRRGARFAVNSAQSTPQALGRFGASGVMWIEATGTIAFAQDGRAGVFGNSSYRYYWKPVRNGFPAGALLLRAGDEGWKLLTELETRSGAFKLVGSPGEMAYVIVNDAREYFEDNQGSFNVLVWPDGEGPK